MATHFITCMPLHVACIITGVPVTASMTWDRIAKSTLFYDLIKLELQKTRRVPVDQRNPQARVF